VPIKPDRNCTHLAGEYFVAAELYKRGFSVAITIGNAKAIDLFAEKNGKTVSIQVKAISSKKSVCWPIKLESVLDSIIFIFVCLNGVDDTPTYFILDAQETRSFIKRYKMDVIDYTPLKRSTHEGKWEKLETI
jgi:hypothetical protein